MKSIVKIIYLFGIGTIMVLPGCVKANTETKYPTLSPRYAEDLRMMQKAGSFNEFETQILEDAWVTDEEWNQAKSLYYACMNQHGLEGDLGDGSRLEYGATLADQDKFAANYPPEDRMKALDKIMQLASDCAIGTVEGVGIYYFEPRNNPDGVEHQEAVRRCITKTSFASDFAGLNDEEMQKLLDELTLYNDTPELLPCRNGIYGDW